MTWAAFRFGNPWALWLFALLPLLALLKGRAGAAPSVRYSSLSIFKGIGALRKSRAGWPIAGLLLASLGCFVVGLARPQLAEKLSHSNLSGIDIILALDVSGSMAAEDVTIGDAHRRIDAVKAITQSFIESRPSDRIGMVAFAGRPYLVSPLTLDHDWLLKNLERVDLGLVEDGTAIGSAIASCANRLRDRKESKSRIIILLTDGGNNAGKVSPATAAEAARALGIKIYTIGIGANGEAPIHVKDQWGRMVLRMIPADLDEKTLKQIAQIGGGEYFRAESGHSLERVFGQIDKLEKTTVEVTTHERRHDLFEWFIGAGLALLALSVALEQTFLKRLP